MANKLREILSANFNIMRTVQSKLKGINNLAFRYKAIRKGIFRLSLEYEIEYGYDFRISNQWRFQSPRSRPRSFDLSTSSNFPLSVVKLKAK